MIDDNLVSVTPIGLGVSLYVSLSLFSFLFYFGDGFCGGFRFSSSSSWDLKEKEGRTSKVNDGR